MVMGFGSYVRALREKRKKDDPSYSLRKIAQAIKVTPSYLSQLESEQVKPSDEMIISLSKILGEDPDTLFIRAGRVSPGCIKIISKHPEPFVSLIKQLKNSSGDAILRIVREVRDGDW